MGLMKAGKLWDGKALLNCVSNLLILFGNKNPRRNCITLARIKGSYILEDKQFLGKLWAGILK